MTHTTPQSSRGLTASSEPTPELLEHLPCGVILVEANGQISFANIEAERILGYTKTELLTLYVEQLVPENFRGRHESFRKAFVKEPTSRAMGAGVDLYALRKDGSTVSVEIGLSPLVNQGRPQVLCSISDISERKRMEGELKRSHADLDIFAYTVAHDLKEPLRGLLRLVDFLLDDCEGQLPDIALSYLDRITLQGHRMHDLIETLLRYGQLRRSEVHASEVDMNQLVREVKEGLEPTIQQSEVEVVISESLPGASCDPTLVREVLYNLVSNGIKYNTSPLKRIEVWYDTEKGAYAVSDNGIGIPESQAEDIFNLFCRLQSSETNQKGHGLGLAIVRWVVEKHQGKIWIKSKEGQGTTFYFTLKLDSAPKCEEKLECHGRRNG